MKSINSQDVSINPDICECIGFLATQMRDWISSTFDEGIRTYNLNYQQAGILWRCYQEPCCQVRLCRLVKVDKNYVRFLIDDLEQKGLVYRFKNPKNRKENLICLTQRGAEVCQETFALMLKTQEDLLQSVLSQDQIKTLHSLLLRVFESIESKKD